MLLQAQLPGRTAGSHLDESETMRVTLAWAAATRLKSPGSVGDPCNPPDTLSVLTIRS